MSKNVLVTGSGGIGGVNFVNALRVTKKEIEDVVGIDTSNAISCSGKTGDGVDDILEAIV